jgi:hypothetical protein
MNDTITKMVGEGTHVKRYVRHGFYVVRQVNPSTVSSLVRWGEQLQIDRRESYLLREKPRLKSRPPGCQHGLPWQWAAVRTWQMIGETRDD